MYCLFLIRALGLTFFFIFVPHLDAGLWMRHNAKGFASDEELGTLYAFLFKNPGVLQAYRDVTGTKLVTNTFIGITRIVTITDC